MYYYLNGTLVTLFGGYAAIDCGGVCYKLTVSNNTYSALAKHLGKTAKLYTYLSVREDAMELFGFYSEDEHSAFTKLITVSGVGPKAAISILSTLSVDRLISAIANNDPKAISMSPGVGLKTAQKIILDLKDKMKIEQLEGVEDIAPTVSSSKASFSEAVDTLLVLGYTRSEAVNAVKGCDPSLSLEDIIKVALKKLSKDK